MLHRMFSTKLVRLALPILLVMFSPTQSRACRQVADDENLLISQSALRDVATIGLDRDSIFASLRKLSIPEARGCWSDAVGSFDGALLSVGAVQSNFSSGTLQVLLHRFRDSYKTKGELQSALNGVIDVKYQNILFSEGCLSRSVTAQCQTELLDLQLPYKVLDPIFKAQVDALFDTPEMDQLQLDAFVLFLGKLKTRLSDLFGHDVSPLEVKWAIDLDNQQGGLGFPSATDAAEARAELAGLTEAQRRARLLKMLSWYDALCNSFYVEGISRDFDYNFQHWTTSFQNGKFSADQLDLLLLTFLASRMAGGGGGKWQALAFERRAGIVLGMGSVAGSHIP